GQYRCCGLRAARSRAAARPAARPQAHATAGREPVPASPRPERGVAAPAVRGLGSGLGDGGTEPGRARAPGQVAGAAGGRERRAAGVAARRRGPRLGGGRAAWGTPPRGGAERERRGGGRGRPLAEKAALPDSVPYLPPVPERRDTARQRELLPGVVSEYADLG